MFAGDTFFSREKKTSKQNKKHSFKTIFPENVSYKKVNENRKICSETIFIETFSYEDFGRILEGFWEDFVIFLAV